MYIACICRDVSLASLEGQWALQAQLVQDYKLYSMVVTLGMLYVHFV